MTTKIPQVVRKEVERHRATITPTPYAQGFRAGIDIVLGIFDEYDNGQLQVEPEPELLYRITPPALELPTFQGFGGFERLGAVEPAEVAVPALHPLPASFEIKNESAARELLAALNEPIRPIQLRVGGVPVPDAELPTPAPREPEPLPPPVIEEAPTVEPAPPAPAAPPSSVRLLEESELPQPAPDFHKLAVEAMDPLAPRAAIPPRLRSEPLAPVAPARVVDAPPVEQKRAPWPPTQSPPGAPRRPWSAPAKAPLARTLPPETPATSPRPTSRPAEALPPARAPLPVPDIPLPPGGLAYINLTENQWTELSRLEKAPQGREGELKRQVQGILFEKGLAVFDETRCEITPRGRDRYKLGRVPR